MRLRLTVTAPAGHGFGPGSAAPLLREVEVVAPQGSTADQLAAALAVHVAGEGLDSADRPDTAHLTVAGGPVPGATAVGRAPLLDGAAVMLVPGAAPTPPRHPDRPGDRHSAGRTPAVLAVSHGPDAGHTVELSRGRHTIGRSPEADVCLADPLLSRVHAEVLVGPDTITVRDCGSTNGTTVVGPGRSTNAGSLGSPLAPGAAVRLGDTQLLLRPTRTTPAATVATNDGTRLVNPRPRVQPDHEEVAFELPSPPERAPRRPLPWVAVVLPIPVAAVMALFFGPMMLAFAAMGHVLMVGTHLSDRVGTRRRYAVDLAEHARRLTEVEGRVAAACAHETRARRRALPDPAAVLGIAADATARLWERRCGDDDALTVSIGTCTTPATLRLIRAEGGLVEPPRLADVPCGVELAALGVFGVCGSDEFRSGVARSMVGQLASLHSPRDLSFVLLAGSRASLARWQWLARLPHLRQPDGSGVSGSVAALGRDAAEARSAVRTVAAIVAHRREHRRSSGPWAGPRTVLVLDGGLELRAVPGLAEILERGPDVGVVALALADEESALPSETRGWLDLTEPARPVLHVPGHRHDHLVVDRVGAWWSDRLSRGLAPLRDATARSVDGELPDSTTLTQLLDRTTEPESIAAGWRQQGNGVSVPVGATTRGAWHVDLDADGPHVLVGGTTGSGKSEFLRSLVTSLAVHHPPDEVSFVLVDYKGGAAFRECADLPHTSGLVTDLDDHLARRALVSLTAELRRREHLFAQAGVRDYQAFRRNREQSMPRLVIVVDEFRALAEELPSFVDGMVRIAALGRSLGVHLVLATQRPAGVVTADIKANVNLRIALRVRDRADSDDVLEAPDAASLDPALPGRGYARVGGGELVAFQAAHCAAPAMPLEPDRIEVTSVVWPAAPAEPRQATTPHTPPQELTRLVGSIREAARLLPTTTTSPAWLPPLPTRLMTIEVEQPASPRRHGIGLVDRPEQQTQERLDFDLDGRGQWALVGTVGSGRTTALRTIAAVVTSRLGPSEVHLYAVSSGGLADLAELPHCAAHVPLDDLGRLERLVDRLASRATDQPAGSPTVLLLVDDWELLASRTDSLEHHALAERLLTVIRAGDRTGLRAVVAGDRSLLSGRAASTLSQRLLLRTTDCTDALLAGITPHSLPVDPGPGRGTWSDGAEVQLAQGEGLRPKTGVAAGGRLPRPIAALPAHVTLDSVRPPASHGFAGVAVDAAEGAATAPRDRVLLGAGGDEAAPVGLTPGRDGRRWLVAGPSGSGVSTALATMATSLLHHRRPVALVSPRSGPLALLRGQSGLQAWSDGVQVDELVAAREAHPDLCVVVDSGDELLDLPADAVLRQICRLVDRDGGLLVVGANSSTLATQYRGVAVDVARHRTGVLLRPDSITDGDLFGVRVRVDREAPPGRGHLVTQAGVVPVQVAEPELPTADARDVAEGRSWPTAGGADRRSVHSR